MNSPGENWKKKSQRPPPFCFYKGRKVKQMKKKRLSNKQIAAHLLEHTVTS